MHSKDVRLLLAAVSAAWGIAKPKSNSTSKSYNEQFRPYYSMKKLRTWGRRYANLLVIIILAIVLIGNQNTKYLKVNLTPLSINTTTSATSNNTTTLITNDGCGRVNNRNSSTWRNLQPYEIANSTQVQTCLKRIGRSNFATPVIVRLDWIAVHLLTLKL